MPNTVITSDIVAKEALVQLENNLVMGKLVYRDTESYFGEEKVGATVRMRRPVQYKVRRGSQASVYPVTDGTVAVTVGNQTGVDIQFSSTDLTLSIDRFSERYLKPAMIDIATAVDTDLFGLYAQTYNWTGAPGNSLSKYGYFADGVRRLDDYAVPKPRVAMLAPVDWHALGATFTALPGAEPIAKMVLEQAKLPSVAGADAYMSQSVINHVNGAWAGLSGAVDPTGGQNVPYEGSSAAAVTARTTYSQTYNISGLTGATTINAGDVFMISGVYGVNPRTKAQLSNLQQFTVLQSVTTSSGAAALTISPPIISDTTSAYQNVSAAPAANAPITLMGAGSGSYPQNLIFNKDAYALTMVPMILPPGAVNPARQSYKGLSIRVIPVYDGISDSSMWRLDVLYGVTCLDPRLATRVSGNTY